MNDMQHPPEGGETEDGDELLIVADDIAVQLHGIRGALERIAAALEARQAPQAAPARPTPPAPPGRAQKARTCTRCGVEMPGAEPWKKLCETCFRETRKPQRSSTGPAPDGPNDPPLHGPY